MSITKVQNEYVIPRGVVFFNLYENQAYEGERELGNCPSYLLTIETEKTEHYSSRQGIRQKDLDVVVQIDRTAVLTVDNLSVANLALFFGADVLSVTQDGTPVVDEPHTVKQGLIYQLGHSTANPPGVRNVSSVMVTDDTDTTTYVEGTDYELDATMGRIRIIPGGGISDNDVIHVDYTPDSSTRTRIQTGNAVTRHGALRSIADNAQGANHDFYAPYASMTPTGDLPVITDETEVVSMQFDVEYLKPEDTSMGETALYIDGRPV